MKVVCVIQARINSTRLPGKVMLQVAGGTILQTVVERVRAAKRVDRVVVATSMSKADAEITRWCWSHGVDCFRGSEADVLDRVYQAALSRGADYVVDITADCPLVDPRHIDRIIGEVVGDRVSWKTEIPDYSSNCFVRDWPDGLDIQCYTMEALRRACDSKSAVREHVGWNIAKLAEELDVRVHQTFAPKRYRHPEWGLTLDEMPDYAVLKKLFAEMVLRHGNNLFPVEDALDYLGEHPELLTINAGICRKEPGRG